MRARRQDSTRPTDRLAIGSALVGGALVAVLVLMRGSFLPEPPSISRLVAEGGGQPQRVQSGHQAAQAPTVAVSALPTPVPQPTPIPQPSPTPATQPVARMRVANTDGEGVVLRASPRTNDWTPRGFMDGEWVTVLDRSGQDWALIRGDNGQEGWVPVRYLRP